MNAQPDASQMAIARATRERELLSDALGRVGIGDRKAFEFLYRRTSAKLFGVCLRIFGNRNEAEEALQDAYLTIWSRAAAFDRDRASPISWLVAITRNRAIDRLRARDKGKPVDLEEALAIPDPAPDAEKRLEEKDEARVVDSCIERLDDRDANFIRAAFWNGRTYADLAVAESTPLPTVKSRIRRALIKLRHCLEGMS
ncbi:MAG TPA: sigma-70 family RNA polymerase sigma factor [Sphingorhabdus sp.]|jgi:RNA polymerase sigma-70 factor (ECF subfamily)|uniref:sigma-70 family RNA polymerase sigma factor n=1 Tax=Sphingorhabdus sp. TaxID=1902408 RepID=UPI002CCF9130|nr:sigma-70 family RNA polymerase sigma factor [Sphingorhabdus sp.]HMT41190.1 sigma-70 family RNA polymerase sigma factor [Sphingorhabdus sp.]HMU21248.1 sigma-70 family RNA polymerase sigma factor [Sphingorhabdus sp.]